MECQCKPGWTGHFCHKPICRPGCNETTGFCSKPGECWCRVGWTGPKCETCVPYPGCQNGFCEQPWECKCTGDYVGMLCDKLASETTTVQYHPTTLPPIPPQNTGQPFTIIQGLLFSSLLLQPIVPSWRLVKSFDFVQMSLVYVFLLSSNCVCFCIGPKGQPVYKPSKPVYKPSVPVYPPSKPVYKPSLPTYPSKPSLPTYPSKPSLPTYPSQPSFIAPPNKPQPYPQPYPQNPYYASNTALPDNLKGDDENVSDSPLDVVSAFDFEV